MFLKTIDLVIRKSRGYECRLTNQVPASQDRLVLSVRPRKPVGDAVGDAVGDFGPEDSCWYANGRPRTAAEYVFCMAYGRRKFSDEQREAIKMFVSSGSSNKSICMLDMLIMHWDTERKSVRFSDTELDVLEMFTPDSGSPREVLFNLDSLMPHSTWPVERKSATILPFGPRKFSDEQREAE